MLIRKPSLAINNADLAGMMPIPTTLRQGIHRGFEYAGEIARSAKTATGRSETP